MAEKKEAPYRGAQRVVWAQKERSGVLLGDPTYKQWGTEGEQGALPALLEDGWYIEQGVGAGDGVFFVLRRSTG